MTIKDIIWILDDSEILEAVDSLGNATDMHEYLGDENVLLFAEAVNEGDDEKAKEIILSHFRHCPGAKEDFMKKVMKLPTEVDVDFETPSTDRAEIYEYLSDMYGYNIEAFVVTNNYFDDIRKAASKEYEEVAKQVMSELAAGPSDLVDVGTMFADMASIYLNMDDELSGEAERDAFSGACNLLTGKYISEIAKMIIERYETAHMNSDVAS